MERDRIFLIATGVLAIGASCAREEHAPTEIPGDQLVTPTHVTAEADVSVEDEEARDVTPSPPLSRKPERPTPVNSVLETIRAITELAYPEFHSTRFQPERFRSPVRVTAPRGLNVRTVPNRAEEETVLTALPKGTELYPSARVTITFPDERVESWLAVRPEKLEGHLQRVLEDPKRPWVFVAEDIGEGSYVAPLPTPTPSG